MELLSLEEGRGCPSWVDDDTLIAEVSSYRRWDLPNADILLEYRFPHWSQSW